MLLPPPGLFTTVRLVGTSLFCTRMRSTVRAVLSLLPPGAEPTTISTFLCGDQPCAAAAPAAHATSAARAMRVNFMLCPPFGVLRNPQASPAPGGLQFLELRRLDHARVFRNLVAHELVERRG